MAPASAAAPKPAFAAGSLQPDIERRIEALIARMTPEEKAGQLSLYAPATETLANPATGTVSEAQQLDDIRAGRVTGLFNDRSRAHMRRAQEVAVHESRLGIPLLFGADVIHGFRTVFPVPLAEAASWEPALAERTARAAAEEATAAGLRWTFAPMVDIARDARWGRSAEGAGEDPYLGRQFAAARVRGFQGPDLARPDAMLATPKHFAGYGAAEGGLDYNSAELSERTLREVYLPPFRAAIDAGALSVMAGFHDIAGIPSTANPWLLTQVLHGEWGFQGFVVSDYTADAELVAHGVAADGRQAAKLAFLAGTDMSMQSGLYMHWLPALVAAGEVPMARLDQAVRRVLRVKARLGLFDRPFQGLEEPPGEAVPDGPAPAPVTDAAAQTLRAHQVLAREAAQRAIVLLKNQGELLPLRRDTRIALIGPFGDAGAADSFGPWTLFHGDAAPRSLAQALRAALARPQLLTVVAGAQVQAPLPGGIEAAVAAARAADVVVLAIGESEAMSGEARSRSEIVVPPAQQALAEAVAATGKPVVVVLSTGRALALQGAVRAARSIVVGWFLGDQGGNAMADILLGAVSPSGRLPVSFPQTPGQEPYHYDHRSTGRPVRDSEPDAPYHARYLDTLNEALYPFGHGLGYGHVQYEQLTLSAPQLPWNGTLTVHARIRNTGTRAADEVVQLYLHQRAASVAWPVRSLRGFHKLRIAPGESAEVDFTITRADLGFIGRELRPVVEPGEFDLWVAPSATGGLHARFDLSPP